MPHPTPNPSVGRVGTPPSVCRGMYGPPSRAGVLFGCSVRKSHPVPQQNGGCGTVKWGSPPSSPPAPPDVGGSPMERGGPVLPAQPRAQGPLCSPPRAPAQPQTTPLPSSNLAPPSPSPPHSTEGPPPKIGGAQPHGATPPAPPWEHPDVSAPAPLPPAGWGSPQGHPQTQRPPPGVFWDGYF